MGPELAAEELGTDAELATAELGASLADDELATAELGAWLADDELATAELTGGSELAGTALEGSVEVGPA